MIYLGVLWEANPYIGIALAAVVFIIELFLFNKILDKIYAIAFGLLFGLLTAGAGIKCLQLVFNVINPELVLPEPLLMMFVLISCYIGIGVALKYFLRFKIVIPFIQFSRERRGSSMTLLDTSILIDGRILDICDTRIIQGKFLVPIFILEELQKLSDSADKIKRNRGRRGLDVLGRMKMNKYYELELLEETREPNEETDQALLRVAETLSVTLMTNDFNLSKLARVKDVHVLNLNDLCLALKPQYIPGEKLNTEIIKKGESHAQRVGYLPDGTMVVVEKGVEHIGKHTDIIVTSIIQTQSGKMLFGKIA
jgi:uncharacterized protein YacL